MYPKIKPPCLVKIWPFCQCQPGCKIKQENNHQCSHWMYEVFVCIIANYLHSVGPIISKRCTSIFWNWRITGLTFLLDYYSLETLFKGFLRTKLGSTMQIYVWVYCYSYPTRLYFSFIDTTTTTITNLLLLLY